MYADHGILLGQLACAASGLVARAQACSLRAMTPADWEDIRTREKEITAMCRVAGIVPEMPPPPRDFGAWGRLGIPYIQLTRSAPNSSYEIWATPSWVQAMETLEAEARLRASLLHPAPPVASVPGSPAPRTPEPVDAANSHARLIAAIDGLLADAPPLAGKELLGPEVEHLERLSANFDAALHATCLTLPSFPDPNEPEPEPRYLWIEFGDTGLYRGSNRDDPAAKDTDFLFFTRLQIPAGWADSMGRLRRMAERAMLTDRAASAIGTPSGNGSGRDRTPSQTTEAREAGRPVPVEVPSGTGGTNEARGESDPGLDPSVPAADHPDRPGADTGSPNRRAPAGGGRRGAPTLRERDDPESQAKVKLEDAILEKRWAGERRTDLAKRLAHDAELNQLAKAAGYREGMCLKAVKAAFQRKKPRRQRPRGR
jgi:hypothetical protein